MKGLVTLFTFTCLMAEPAPTAEAATETVVSTAYCLTGKMKSGKKVYDGAVAVPKHRYKKLLHTRWQIVDGPLAGKRVVVEDQIGHSSQFDVAMPGRCDAARKYGRRTIKVRRLS